MSESAQLRVQLCGRFAFVSADQASEPELPGRRGRLLLAYLAVHRDRPVARAQLQDALWGDRAATSGAATLNVLLSKTRAVIAPATIDGRGAFTWYFPPD